VLLTVTLIDPVIDAPGDTVMLLWLASIEVPLRLPPEVRFSQLPVAWVLIVANDLLRSSTPEGVLFSNWLLAAASVKIVVALPIGARHRSSTKTKPYAKLTGMSAPIFLEISVGSG